MLLSGEHMQGVRGPSLLHQDRGEPRIGGSTGQQGGQSRRP
jgi:hypothetical protein